MKTTRKGRAIIPLVAVITTALTMSTSAAFAAPTTNECQKTSSGAVVVTPDCIDTQFNSPVIDSQTDETSPVPHHRVSGHFAGTNISFNIYLHTQSEKSKWQGRFFQYSYPTTFSPDQDTSRANDRAIGFALSSGGYAVQAGNASVSLGYRHDAAAAKFAEKFASEWYGRSGPIFGYLYGPSGGSFQTIGAAENTEGVWQGFVPMVQGVPTPSSYNFNGRAAAELILSDKRAEIRDALLPGGSGDPYATLDAAQKAMLTELHLLGIPWQGWENPDYLLGYDPSYFGSGLSSDAPLDYDPTYVNDFWNAPGYLGTETSPLGDRVRAKLGEMGDTVGHRWNIAKRFAYRYQLPPAGAGWIALDQFRNPDGLPKYPQRAVKEPNFTNFVSGSTAFDGSLNGKMIVVDNLYDVDALPIHADWYRKKVEASLGAAAKDTYRLYYTDHADHQDAPPTGDRAASLVDWYGSVEQALRDIARWAEQGVPAPASTNYTVEDSQIVVKAKERGGVQPTVEFAGARDGVIRAKTGRITNFLAQARTPDDGSKIVNAEWDFDADGTYEPGNRFSQQKVSALKASHRFTEPGTYFVSVRVTSERAGNALASFALVQNIARIRVVVK